MIIRIDKMKKIYNLHRYDILGKKAVPEQEYRFLY